MQTKNSTLRVHFTFSRPIYPGIKGGGGKSRPHTGRPERPQGLFSPGETVRETGIYEAIHDRAHRIAHEVVMLNGDAFPPCDTCEQRVRFRLIRTAPYIFQDEDFGEPSC
jgi:hypothetical protein